MKMSMDNSIRLLEDYHKWEKQFGIFGSGVDDATKKLLEVAKKYQKIQEIMKSKKMNAFNIGVLIPKDMACVLHEIKEVIEEDGNE